jgi:hypothetical protein
MLTRTLTDPARVAPLLVASAALAGACARPAGGSTERGSMTRPLATIPIACRPGALDDQERQRSQALRAELAAAAIRADELPDGYRFTCRPDAAIFQKAAEWVGLERRCCPFLAFELSWAQGDGRAPQLSLTGPEGTKAFLAAELPALRVAAPAGPR